VFCLLDVRAAFPEATFVWTHRDPFAALSSVCSLVTVVRSLCTDHVDRASLGPRQTALWADGIERGLRARDALGDDAFVDVFMDDLVRDPMATMHHLYDQLGWPLTDRAEGHMRAWLAGNPQHGRGDHDPDPAEFGLDAAAVRERFAAYRQRFEMEGTDG
jgi:hypothetical protein